VKANAIHVRVVDVLCTMDVPASSKNVAPSPKVRARKSAVQAFPEKQQQTAIPAPPSEPTVGLAIEQEGNRTIQPSPHQAQIVHWAALV